jgi:uncharacterized membrane protein YhhN
MITIKIALSLLAALSAILCIQGKYANQSMKIYVFKPLTTGLIIFFAILSGFNLDIQYIILIYIGLVFSLFGDVFLMLPNKFIFGLISFLLAHICFLVFFITLYNDTHILLVLLFSIAGASIYFTLFPFLGKMKVPVLVYLIIIFAMAWRGWEYYIGFKNTASIIIAIATILFIFSDTNIALNKFRKQYNSAEFLILSTYYMSIWLIALALNFI